MFLPPISTSRKNNNEDFIPGSRSRRNIAQDRGATRAKAPTLPRNPALPGRTGACGRRRGGRGIAGGEHAIAIQDPRGASICPRRFSIAQSRTLNFSTTTAVGFAFRIRICTTLLGSRGPNVLFCHYPLIEDLDIWVLLLLLGFACVCFLLLGLFWSCLIMGPSTEGVYPCA